MKSFFYHPLRVLVGLLVVMAGVAHAQPSSPTVATLPASVVGATTATLNGIGNPHFEPAFGFFQWGTTTNYGNVTSAQALGNGTSDTNFSQAMSGLLFGTTYHFRAVASNSSAVVFGTNQSFTTANFIFSALTTFGNGDGWLAPGEGGYTFLGTAHNERGLAYGNGHLYLVSRNGGNTVRILDPLTGSDVGELNTNGISGGFFAMNMIAVAGDGAIYVGNLTTQSAGSPFKIYRWANEGSTSTVAYSGDAGLAGARVGDTLAAIGNGSSTRLAAGFNSSPPVIGNNGYTVIDPTAGTAKAIAFLTPPNTGDFRLGLTFSDSSHVLGTQGSSLYRYTSFAGATGTLLGSPAIPDPAGATADRLLAYTVVGGVPLLAVQSIGDSHVSIYDVTSPATPIWLGSANNTSGTLTANGNATGALAWGDISEHAAHLWAMSSNQGIQAFLVVVPSPILSPTRFNGKIVLSWSTNFSGYGLESSTNLGSPAVWAAVSPAPVVLNTNYVVTNSITGNRQFYRLKK